ncbi:AI-2E family transporter [Algoriphagus sediminis]|uniref:AI-2E family transporter n=1 Tax=Algoriphagus sediminis TaxID=3057113 RepID=A0ABT7Y7V2_9BACT|nr:AI-2E family transporter [Algoriphagus sediminis]MDN3202594.1 AI-2E family transporter [Algoriphagus sediminis]
MQRFFIYTFLIILLFCLFGWYFSDITSFFVLSLILSAILRPLTNRLHEFHVLGQHIPRWTAILLSYASIVSVLVLVSFLFFPLINNQIAILSEIDLEGIYERMQVPVSNVEVFLSKYELIENRPGLLFDQIKSTFISTVSEINIGRFISGLINTTTTVLIGLLAVAFITFFLLLENGLLRRNLLNLIPNPYFELSVATFTKIEKLLSNYLTGLLLQVTAIFSLASLGLTIVGVDYALTIALFAAIANLIPYAGPLLGSTFGIIVGLSTGDYESSTQLNYLIIKILAVFGLVQVTDNIFLQPMIFSKSVKAHPLEIFVVIFAGAKLAGVAGMIFAIPVYTIFRVAIIEFYYGYKSYRIFKIK